MEPEYSSAASSSKTSPFLNVQQQRVSSPEQMPELPQLQIRTHAPVQQSPEAPRAVEMSSRKLSSDSKYLNVGSSGGVSWEDLDTSSDDSEDVYALAAVPATTAEPWTAAAAGAFEPFEVEEHATEIKYLRDMYSKKEYECEHLRQIIKELSQSRAKVHKNKVDLEEQFVALQKEYVRVNKVSELARTVSQQAVARSSSLKSELAAAQDQARRSRRRASAAEGKAAALAEENAKLRQQLALLEQVRLSHDDFRTSACAREYLFSHSVSLY